MKMTFEIGKMPPLTDEQKRELEALAKMPDDKINYDDIPPITEEQFARSVPNPYRRKNKVSVTMRVDADVLDWLKRGGARLSDSRKQYSAECNDSGIAPSLTAA